MAVTVLHYGLDQCRRALVHSANGYSVFICADFEEFCAALERKSDVDLVVMQDGDDARHNEIVALTRSRSHASLILFGEGDDRFDLVIPRWISPAVWLQRIKLLIEESRALRASRRRSARRRRASGGNPNC